MSRRPSSTRKSWTVTSGVEAVKAAGMKGLVLTAKHHDGFCLWPTRTTEHSVKNSPLGRDVVKEAAEACRRGGIKFGFYLSPWDRNAPCYGTPAYNDFFCEQLTELLTGYGDIFYVWFDNACGEGPNGKKQEYDFPRYFELIRKYQPGAVIFNDFGPDVRWCGNEAGTARYAEWAVVPTELCHYAQAQTGPGPLAGEGDLSYLYNTAQEIGAMSNILYSKGLAFVPAEIDMSIRPGWFWHPNEEPHSLERLFRTYLDSVGNNACFHLNIPPNREGLFDSRDVARLKEFGDLIQRELGTPLPDPGGAGPRLPGHPGPVHRRLPPAPAGREVCGPPGGPGPGPAGGELPYRGGICQRQGVRSVPGDVHRPQAHLPPEGPLRGPEPPDCRRKPLSPAAAGAHHRRPGRGGTEEHPGVLREWQQKKRPAPRGTGLFFAAFRF